MKRLPLLALPAFVSATALAAAQQPPPATPPSALESGGLRPPEAIPGTETPPPSDPNQSPEKDLAKADAEDSGRGLEWVWLNAEVGAEHLGLGTFKADKLVDPEQVKTTQTGLVYGAAVGVRILVFTAGVRFRMGAFSEWQLWTLNAEGGLRIPIGKLEPYATVGGGYASLGGFSAKGALASDASAKGFNARLGAGLDYYITNTFSVGGNLSGDILFLSRKKAADTPATPMATLNEAAVYTKNGSSIGAGATLTAVVGLHF